MLRNKQIFDIADKCDEGQEGNEFLVAFAYAIESAATAPLLARIAELTRELEEARKDAERLTNEQIDAGIKAWFSTDITINEGKDRGHPFRQRMRAAIRAAIKEQT